jgi:hypothetical protein
MIGNIGDCAAVDKNVVSIPEIPHGRFEKYPWTIQFVLWRFIGQGRTEYVHETFIGVNRMCVRLVEGSILPVTMSKYFK